MRKILSILIAASFLISTSGLTVISHYCMGRFIKSSIAVSDNYHPCGCKGNMPDGCCNNEVHFVKVKDNYQSGVPHSVEFISDVIRILIASPLLSSLSDSSLCAVSEFPPPKIIGDISVFLCTFRI